MSNNTNFLDAEIDSQIIDNVKNSKDRAYSLEIQSDNRISDASKVTKDQLIGIIKEKEGVRYDQMLVYNDTKKEYVYVKYGAISYTRTPYLLTTPLYKDIKNEFEKNYYGGAYTHGKVKKIIGDSIIDKIKSHGKTPVKDVDYDEAMPFHNVPLESKGDTVLDEQPVYFISEGTDSCECHSCDGDKYLPCPESECRGQHIYDCKKCHSSGKLDCDDCNARGEYTCPSCHGRGRLRCTGCGGSGIDAQSNSRNAKCQYCNGSGERNCSSLTGGKDIVHTLVGAAVKKAGGNKYCGGKGIIRCSTCSSSGKITCNKCKGNGQIECETCHSDHKDGRYGKIDCETCETMGEIATISYFETKINYHNKEFTLCNSKAIEAPGFGLETVKSHINQHGKAELTYFSLNGKETEGYDKYSKKYCEEGEDKLGLHKNQYPKIINETVYYENVPCVTLDYNHILSGTQHEVSFIGVDRQNQLLFHSNPIAVEEKEPFSAKYKNWIKKAFNTKSYKDKIDKKNEIYLMIHMAKADGIIEDSEKLYLSKSITDLQGFTKQEKKALFDLMTVKELPPVSPGLSYFSTSERAEIAKSKLVELIAKADSEFEPEEKSKLEEINIAIESGNKIKPKAIAQFFKTWQVSIPLILSVLGLAYGVFWYTNILPATTALTEHERLLILESSIIEKLNDSDTLFVYDDITNLVHSSSLPLQDGQGKTSYQEFWLNKKGEVLSLYQTTKEILENKVGKNAKDAEPIVDSIIEKENIADKTLINFGQYLASIPENNPMLFSNMPEAEEGGFTYLDAQNFQGELKINYLGNDYLGDATKTELKIESFDTSTGKGVAAFSKTKEKIEFQITTTDNGVNIILVREGKKMTFSEDSSHMD